MIYSAVEAAASGERLQILGAFHPESGDDAPEGTGTIALLGPKEPGFWKHASGSAEFADGRPHPLDRWSRRVISAIAREFNAAALFPFGGPPYRPFAAWALRTGRCWTSPIAFLVHDEAGLMVSFRGALALKARLELPLPRGSRPCDDCEERPCTAACPAGVLDESGYDAAGCRSFVGSHEGSSCLEKGCEARRACPVSKRHARSHAQSRFHQEAFVAAHIPC